MPQYTRNARTRLKPRNRPVIYSILNIIFEDGSVIYVYKGALSPNDIWIKYSTNDSAIRTPKHIHWAVDLLIKKFANRKVSNALLLVFIDRWKTLRGLSNRDPKTIISKLRIARDSSILRRFQPLSKKGFFRLDFLLHLMELLMLQEKSNNPDAYMFKDVLEGLLNSRDLYKIISTVTHTGR